MKRRNFCFQTVLGLTAATMPPLFSRRVQAALPGTVTWGGAYLLEDKPGFMPYTRQALQMNENMSPTGEKANKTLLNEIRAHDWSGSGIDLRTGLKKKQTRYGMVFGLAAEQVLATVYLNRLEATQYILRQIGYVTVYDIIDRRIVSCIAVRGRYLDDKPGPPDESLLPSLFFNLLANKDQSGSVARFMVEKIKDYPFEEKYQGKYFKVDPVIFTDLAKLHAEQYNIDLAKYGDDTGFAATTAFSESLKSPLVPYRKTSAVNRNMLDEMKIVAMDAENPLDTSLQLKPSDAGIEITHEGWEFTVTQTSETRNQVALVTRISIRMYDRVTDETVYHQSFYGRQDFNELPQAGLSIDRKSRLFMLHETLLDRAFASINSEEIRGLVYDGEEMSVPGQTTFIQADAEDWGAYGKECNRVAAMLPRAFGS